jgi:uncharacterized protein (DUF697 family)
VEEIFQDTINWEDAIGMKANQVMSYLAVSLAGAAVGGIVVAGMTRAIPKMVTRMMQSMMAEMGGEGCNPADL